MRRGDVERRVRRIKHQIVGVSVCAVLLVAYQSNQPAEAVASPAPQPDPMMVTRALERELDRTKAELAARGAAAQLCIVRRSSRRRPMPGATSLRYSTR
jgi:hypothetical protein